MDGLKKVKTVLGRNPFLSRAGFDIYAGVVLLADALRRNPFLSRAGFDKMELQEEERRLELTSQSLFK